MCRNTFTNMYCKSWKKSAHRYCRTWSKVVMSATNGIAEARPALAHTNVPLKILEHQFVSAPRRRARIPSIFIALLHRDIRRRRFKRIASLIWCYSYKRILCKSVHYYSWLMINSMTRTNYQEFKGISIMNWLQSGC